MPHPDPSLIFPIPNIKSLTYVRPTLSNPNIIVGDFTYIADSDFESHVTHFYDFNHDKLIIGKFCQIAAGVNFIMNGANHQMHCVTTFPFYIFPDWQQPTPPLSQMPIKGDTIIGNDVWLGQNSTILPGVHIGNGAIIGLNSVVGSNVEDYTIVAGNPARCIKKRFDDELINLLLELRWWDLELAQITSLIPILTCNDLKVVKTKLKTYLSTGRI